MNICIDLTKSSFQTSAAQHHNEGFHTLDSPVPRLGTAGETRHPRLPKLLRRPPGEVMDSIGRQARRLPRTAEGRFGCQSIIIG